MNSSLPQHTTESRDDRRKQRELAEARASGNAAPAIDVKSGQMINPHNPEFITKKPWYLGGDNTGPTLDHQAVGEVEQTLSMTTADNVAKAERERVKRKMKLANKTGSFEVGMWVEALKKNKRPYLMAKVTKVSKKGELDLEFEDGSKETRVRPANNRVKATRVGSRNAVQEGQHGKLDYASKRDAYHGYDNEDYRDTVRRFEEREEIRRKKREEEDKASRKKKKEGGEGGEDDSDSNSGGSDDEFADGDGAGKFQTRIARQGGVGGNQMAVTARNLRIREDTAKYLRNLDPNSAYYDPKSRSMRDNPNPEVNPDDLQFAGDNFVRYTGDAVDLADTQLFAWDAAGKGNDIHAQSNPSQAELMKKKHKKKKEGAKEGKRRAVLDKYGGEEYLEGGEGLGEGGKAETAEERKVRLGEAGENREYSRDGRVVKGGGIKVPVKTKYDEDVFPNGHKCVWGSYFHKGAFRWGYADDHSLLKSSYYTGVNGKKANDDANAARYGSGVQGSAQLQQARDLLKGGAGGGGASGAGAVKRSELYGEADANAKFDDEKLREAIRKEEEFQKNAKEGNGAGKRKYNSMNADTEVTPEEMEAYRIKKARDGDLMDKLAGTDTVLEYK